MRLSTILPHLGGESNDGETREHPDSAQGAEGDQKGHQEGSGRQGNRKEINCLEEIKRRLQSDALELFYFREVVCGTRW